MDRGIYVAARSATLMLCALAQQGYVDRDIASLLRALGHFGLDYFQDELLRAALGK